MICNKNMLPYIKNERILIHERCVPSAYLSFRRVQDKEKYAVPCFQTKTQRYHCISKFKFGLIWLKYAFNRK